MMKVNSYRSYSSDADDDCNTDDLLSFLRNCAGDGEVVRHDSGNMARSWVDFSSRRNPVAAATLYAKGFRVTSRTFMLLQLRLPKEPANEEKVMELDQPVQEDKEAEKADEPEKGKPDPEEQVEEPEKGKSPPEEPVEEKKPQTEEHEQLTAQEMPQTDQLQKEEDHQETPQADKVEIEESQTGEQHKEDAEGELPETKTTATATLDEAL